MASSDSDDAVRMLPPGAPKPDSPSGYTAGAGRWVYSWDETGEVPVLETYRDGRLWGAVLSQEEYIVSDGEHTAVMPAPPSEGVWFATMGDPGSTPEWRRLYLDNVVTEETWVANGARTIMTIYNDVTSWTVPVVSFWWVAHCRAVKAEYRRRTRRRNR